ncbi:uncharacterized protein N7484_008203, partial [Penicillium longicatenatum]|uniref:uncharacterized protein n=1 Tax=Penicillium longicatenatum TaxID=1561947 RepID=UPI002547C05C
NLSYADQLESTSRDDNDVETPTGTQVLNVSSPTLTPSQWTITQYRVQHPLSSNISQTRPPSTIASGSVEDVNLLVGYHTQGDVGKLVTKAILIIWADFKEHLAGNVDMGTSDIAEPLPSLELQQQFLLPSDDQIEETTDAALNGHALLISPQLEQRGYSLPSQCALLGRIAAAGNGNSDLRIFLNTNIPFSAFICGIQGSGKSHTTACIIENCSMDIPALGTLKASISTLVLQFDEYTSTVSSQPSEAAFLARFLPQYARERQVQVRVLVSPTNFHNLEKIYSQIPNVEVRPFKLQPEYLNITMMLSLMSISQNGGMPLYMAQVTRVLRDMAMESGGYFDYSDFRARLNALNLDRSQTPFLYQRLDLLDSYLELTGNGGSDYYVDGGVTILDLSCPFVDQCTACILFRIAIDLFLNAHPSRGKMIIADEAHKYVIDSPAAKALTETFLTIIRQQRHLRVRIIISTQGPTISPRLIDLCSLTIIHRFTSPEWYKTIEKHLPIDSGRTQQHCERVVDGFHRIARLQTGEAIVFASSAHLVGEDGTVINTSHETFKMRIRNRVTWDGGRTIMCIR